MMTRRSWAALVTVTTFAIGACAGSETGDEGRAPNNGAGKGGGGNSAGRSGSAGGSGTAGGSGSAGESGTAGESGSGGGSAGADAGGRGGSSGSGGSSGGLGSGGTAGGGSGGTAGSGAVGTGGAPPDCVRAVWAHLEACGWAGPANTGYRAGTALTATTRRTITADNTVIDGERIQGGLEIAAKNVMIKNSHVSSNFAAGEAANGTGVINVHPGASATIEDTRLDGENRTHSCVWHEGSELILRRIDCSRVNDGVFVWDAAHFTVQDSYFHALTDESANGHIDGFQTEGASNGVIRHNTYDIPDGQNACVAIWNGRRDSNDILVDKNLMAGSGFAVYAEDYSPSEASPQGGYAVTAIRFTDNVFSTRYYACVGSYGVWYPRGNPTDGWTRTGNKVLETGESIDNGNPHDGSRVCN